MPGEPIAERSFGSRSGMRALAFLMRVFPRVVVYAIALLPVVWYTLKRKDARRASAAYQEQLNLHHGRWRRFLFCLAQAKEFSRVILDNMYLGLFGAGRFVLDLRGTQVFIEALARKKGLILLSAHAGNWHLAVNYLWNTKARVHLVIDDARHEEVRRQMDLAKERAAHLSLHDPSRGMDLLFELKAALARGEVVILAGDRVTSGRKARLSFLGNQAWFPTTRFYLSQVSQAPICLALSFRTGMQRYVCYGVLLPEPASASGQRKAADLHAQSFADELGRLLRLYPRQWYNFYDFFAK